MKVSINISNMKSINKLYLEIREKLSLLINTRYYSEEDKQLQKEVNADILLNMFENFKDSHERIIESLTAENNVNIND
jgi:hypothetical protein